MTQEKMGRVITACVSAGTVLLVCLLSFLMYQWITIAVKNKKIEKLEGEIMALEMQYEEALTLADSMQTVEWLKWQLDEKNFELGLIQGKK